ncbi:PIG-L deacetylase family protein [uncultured Brevibacillus sp.]|uniref:PIG-L deacetylase family protein n=1 Tax=uncultured Brevibacillus sp. TaxID=169970 RepID=UPI002597D667|nr:PIG-L deacetylase family protein [uncultured Brevibacillus sp.]
MKKRYILFIYAHPDDETFASGITISKYSQDKNTLSHLLCATRGQAGKAGDPPICSVEELPQQRESELRMAASILGLASVELLDYEDKHLGEVPSTELVHHIHTAIEKFQPEVVVTFAPHGISGHPDHRAISAATTQAIHSLPKNTSVRKLYYATRASNSTFGAIQPPYSDPIESITTEIAGPQYRPQVAEALRAHRTQHLSVERVFPGVTTGEYASVPLLNQYILAWTNLADYKITGKEDDFFYGIN